MARQSWLFCNRCYRDQIFAFVYKNHGLFSGGHEDWRCTVCGDCNYGPARNH